MGNRALPRAGDFAVAHVEEEVAGILADRLVRKRRVQHKPLGADAVAVVVEDGFGEQVGLGEGGLERVFVDAASVEVVAGAARGHDDCRMVPGALLPGVPASTG